MKVSQAADWSARREIGSITVLRLAIWIALKLGRSATRLLLMPVCAGFAIFYPTARTASRQYLTRVFGRPAKPWEVLQHFVTFGTTVLDRVYLLKDRASQFKITIHGEEVVTEIIERGAGCLLLGAHHGSFEVLRLLGSSQPNLCVSLAMFEETGRKISTALNAINPQCAPRIIALGNLSAMIEIKNRLEQGDFVGMLADRTLSMDGTTKLNFLGSPANFPTGPARLAALLRPPVVLMIGLFRGGNQYEIHFEKLASAALAKPDPAETTELINLYVARLEHFCRLAPYNWFNFFNFWA